MSDAGWHIEHGDVDRAVEVLREIASAAPERLKEMGTRASEFIETDMKMERMVGKFCDILEDAS